MEGGQKAPTLPIASSSSSRSVPVHEFGGGRRGGEEGGERERGVVVDHHNVGFVPGSGRIYRVFFVQLL